MCCQMALAKSAVRTDEEEEHSDTHRQVSTYTHIYLFIETDISSIKIGLSRLNLD